MLADLALFVQNAIAESGVLLPKRIENSTDGRKFARQTHFDLTVGKRF